MKFILSYAGEELGMLLAKSFNAGISDPPVTMPIKKIRNATDKMILGISLNFFCVHKRMTPKGAKRIKVNQINQSS